MANTAHTSGMARKRQTEKVHDQLAMLEDVRSLAYTIYESRGGGHGHDLDDWLLAEQRVMLIAAQRLVSGPRSHDR